VNELIKKIKLTVPDNYPVNVRFEDFRPGEIRHTYCNIEKAKTHLGFFPETSLDEGLLLTWNWFRNNKALFE